MPSACTHDPAYSFAPRDYRDPRHSGLMIRFHAGPLAGKKFGPFPTQRVAQRRLRRLMRGEAI